MEKNLFMMCEKVNQNAFSELPLGYKIRLCRKDELSIWKAFPFDSDKEAREYESFMTEYFNKVYAPKGNLFFEKCTFVTEEQTDKPVATCFAWKSYECITTIHWLKTLKKYENKGIGRSLLSVIMSKLEPKDYPIYLHTQPESFLAIKLYSDFGFCLLNNPQVGTRTNDLETSLPYLKDKMTETAYRNLRFTTAPKEFLQAVNKSEFAEF
jgi:GNAT superfamily N-acetyltransferase|nr:GNAT family N-acetyltransferase [uncultured Acetatifactor sp.]